MVARRIHREPTISAERLVELGADVRELVHNNALGACGWLHSSPVRDMIQVAAGDVQDRGSVRQSMQVREVVFHVTARLRLCTQLRN